MIDGIYPGDISNNGKFEVSYLDDGTIEITHDMDYDVASTQYIFENNRLKETRQKWGKEYEPSIITYLYDDFGYLDKIDFTDGYYQLSY